MEDKGLEPINENAGSVEELRFGGANVVHWSQLRKLIELCPDLLPETKQAMVAQGDCTQIVNCPSPDSEVH